MHEMSDAASHRRQLLGRLAAAGLGAWLPVAHAASRLDTGSVVSIRSVDGVSGKLRFLCGNLASGAVDLAPELSRQFSGTKWKVRGLSTGFVAFQCLGLGEGPRWLECRPGGQAIGLARDPRGPYSGTAWRALPFEGGERAMVLECAESRAKARWLRSLTKPRPAITTVPAAYERPPAGIRWVIDPYPECIDEPCDPWFSHR